MSTPIHSILIVGGGSAGWITAGILAAKINKDCAPSVTITLVESPNTPTIGVGEGTWPTMRNTLKKMGIRETDFIRECNATFKQGAKFMQWCTGESDDAYYHPLVLPLDFNTFNLAPHWSAKNSSPHEHVPSFADSVCMQGVLCEKGLAPKSITTPEYSAIANYAYHLDAGAFTLFLKKHCTQTLGVQHIEADVTEINNAPSGDIESITTRQAGTLRADLFVDCSGFKSLLLGEHFNVPFISCKHTLFIDTALAVHVPYEADNSPIACHTLSTAQKSGWIWDIGLQNRKGVGHVYSSAHTTETEAQDQLARYLSSITPQWEQLDIRKIQITPGHRSEFWVHNCVAVGLSAGFLEPLEASALVLIEMSANMIADQLPANRNAMSIVAKRFNQTHLRRWQQIIDFLKLHYVLSQRRDTEFWRDNKVTDTIPLSLQEQLSLWQHQPPLASRI